ncbi:MAG: hypothetical protein CBC00_03665, partial [Verrucomicrobia bacterium TMED40]
MKFIKLLSYTKPILFWMIALALLFEVLLHSFLNELPLKFLAHSTGPIHRLGQYSKKDVVPKEHIAIIGDSNVYGFGPWLYDNSWSMGQPAFATHHLLHNSLGKDLIAYGFPGYGPFGYTLSAVAEYNMINGSLIWSKFPEPHQILIVFYEGNDLINNLHEVQHRGLQIDNFSQENFKQQIERLIKDESAELESGFSFTDHIACWNITHGLLKNYLNKFSRESDNIIDPIKDEIFNQIPENQGKPNEPENIALVSGKKISLGYLEGPALHLTNNEINLSLEITKQSFNYIKKKFPQSQIDVVYLSAALSLYDFNNSKLRPAPLKLDIQRETSRDRIFSQHEIEIKNMYLRRAVEAISEEIKIGFIDTTNSMSKIANNYRLHGPRDPIHLNRKGYETF